MRSLRVVALIIGFSASLVFADDERGAPAEEEAPVVEPPAPAPTKWTFCRYRTHSGTQQQSYCTHLPPDAAQLECEAKVGEMLKTTVACACTDDEAFIGAECGAK